MIAQVAKALGEDLRDKVVFVGGCATGLLLTDEFTREQIRHTDDVDLIVDVMTQVDLAKFEKILRQHGFNNNSNDDAHIGSWILEELQVDIIPVNPELLSSASGWCEDAYQFAQDYKMGKYVIKLVTPIYFTAMKLEAYRDRGSNDPLESRDIEDILNLFDGRSELIAELNAAPEKLRKFVSEEIRMLFKNDHFQYAIASTAQSDQEREKLLIERLQTVMDMI